MLRQNQEENVRPKSSSSVTGLETATKHGLVVVFLFALGLITALAFFGLAGVAGETIRQALLFLLGWAAYAVPLAFLVLAYSLLSPGRSFRWLHVVGLIILTLGVTGLLHSTVPAKEQWSAVLAGSGGGALGYISLTPLMKVLGVYGAAVFLVAFVVGGILILFETSLQGLGQGLSNVFGQVRGKVKLPEVHLPKTPEVHDGSDDRPSVFSKVFKSRVVEAPTSPPTRKPEQPPLLELKPSPRRPAVQLSLDLLEDRVGKPTSGDIQANQEKIQKTLQNFGIEVEMSGVNVGPTVTQYTLAPAEGVKLSQITSLSNDLALALAAHPIRIEAPIPGKSLVGIEVPNQAVATVGLKEILASEAFKKRASNLTVSIGKDVAGGAFVADIDRMPHLLIAGATGSGKSVCINTIIISLLYTNSPDDLKLILVDPKRVELTPYNEIPHLLTPVITDTTKTINALKWVVGEMDRRYQVLNQAAKRNLASYNQGAGEKLPYIVVVVDELADLMAVAAADVETAIIRLAQMARAVGIHLVVATQRPSVDVITGLIKANITSRIAFAVASGTDSRTILDTAGAEKLLGRGDCLFVSAELSKPKRLQGAFISDAEIERVTAALKQDAQPDYNPEVVVKRGGGSAVVGGSDDDSDDELLNEAKAEVVRAGKASASLLQRRLRVGYARAARLLDLLEERGIIGPGEGAKPRDVLVSRRDIEQDFATMPDETEVDESSETEDDTTVVEEAGEPEETL